MPRTDLAGQPRLEGVRIIPIVVGIMTGAGEHQRRRPLRDEPRRQRGCRGMAVGFALRGNDLADERLPPRRRVALRPRSRQRPHARPALTATMAALPLAQSGGGRR